jgi:hypothetical protein
VSDILLYKDEDLEVVGELYDDIIGGIILNTEVAHFSLSTYKKFKVVWELIKQDLKQMEIDHVIAIPMDAKSIRWEEHWGFEDTGLVIEGHKIMRCQLW